MRGLTPDEVVTQVIEHAGSVHDGMPVRREDVLAMMTPAPADEPAGKETSTA